MKPNEEKLKEFVLEEIKNKGFKIIELPSFDDEIKQQAVPFPPNLTELTSGVLGDLGAYYTAMWCYAYNQLQLIEVQLLYAENAYDYFYNKAFIEHTQNYINKRPLKDRIIAEVENDEEVVIWQKKKLQYEAIRKMFKAQSLAYERCNDAVSKEIYRRINLVKKGII